MKRNTSCRYEPFASFYSCKSLDFLHFLHPDPLFLIPTKRKECPFAHFQVLFSSCLVQCLLCICKAIFSFQAPGKRGVFLSVNIFVDKIAQQTDKALSGWSQFPLSGADVFVHIWLLILGLYLDSRTQGDVFVKFPPPQALIPSLPLCWEEICWHFLGGCWFWYLLAFPGRFLIWVYFVHGRRGRGSAGQRPCCALEDPSRMNSSPLPAGEGFRLCSFIPCFLKRWSEAAADPHTSILPRYQDGKVIFPYLWSWTSSGCPRATSAACPDPFPHSLVSLSPSEMLNSTSPITSPSSHNSHLYFDLVSLLDIKFEQKKKIQCKMILMPDAVYCC